MKQVGSQACVTLQQTNHTITQIAHACGISDHSHLSREFTRVMGKSGAVPQVTLID